MAKVGTEELARAKRWLGSLRGGVPVGGRLPPREGSEGVTRDALEAALAERGVASATVAGVELIVPAPGRDPTCHALLADVASAAGLLAFLDYLQEQYAAGLPAALRRQAERVRHQLARQELGAVAAEAADIRVANLEGAVGPQLQALASQIEAAQRAAHRAAGRALELARATGDLLLEAQQLAGPRSFRPWFRRCCQEGRFSFSLRSAELYMQIARRWPTIAASPQLAGDLTVAGALRLVRGPGPPPAVLPGDLEFREPAEAVAAGLIEELGPAAEAVPLRRRLESARAAEAGSMQAMIRLSAQESVEQHFAEQEGYALASEEFQRRRAAQEAERAASFDLQAARRQLARELGAIRDRWPAACRGQFAQVARLAVGDVEAEG
jgi:hypothetical protein